VRRSIPLRHGERAGELQEMADQKPGAHLIGLIRSTIPPIHHGGRPIILGAAAGTVGARFILRAVGLKRAGRAVGTLGLAATAGSAAFFRAPIRVRPLADGLVVAPADGLVSLIEQAPPPVELGLDPAPRLRVSIFLSIFDVHVQRIPIDGRITGIVYRPGSFLSADLDKASEVNERNSLVIESSFGGQVVVTQIAGLIARRIVSDVSQGAAVQTGDTYGLIRFGSRVDTYLPAGSELIVRQGQRAIGGETVLARLPGTLS
jgi:phosphatidylserine decarboxylase